jgi:hypothetical protein
VSSPAVAPPGSTIQVMMIGTWRRDPTGKATTMEANSLFDHEASRRAQAQEIADEWLNNPTSNRMNYYVFCERSLPPFEVQWQGSGKGRCKFGVTFNLRDERAAAEQWIITALLAGYTVFRSSTRTGGGSGSGLR